MRTGKIICLFEISNLILTGELILGKSFLKNKNGSYKLLKVFAKNKTMQIYLESESRQLLSLTNNEFRKLDFELVEPKGVICEAWTDPA